MRIVLEQGDGTRITIEREGQVLSIHSLLAGLVEPAVRAAGYTQPTIREVFTYDDVRGTDELFEEV